MNSGKLILKFLCVICILQVILTFYLILKVYVSTVYRPDQLSENEDSYDIAGEYTVRDYTVEGDLNFKINEVPLKNERGLLRTKSIKNVEIWGVAAIASYLWEHILGGEKSVDVQNPSIYSGILEYPKFVIKYKSGPGLQFQHIPIENDILVLVLNGRTQEKVSESIAWIKYIGNFTYVPKIVLVMLGNERCNNTWLTQFFHPNGPVHGAFITYDDSTLDETSLFQWPLGVATYRSFPLLDLRAIDVTIARKYICNLQATNHNDSSRNILFSVLNSYFGSKNCYIKERKQWNPSETQESSRQYLNVLLQSDVTLCPAGFNTETYRVYEALSAGSLPIIEDVPSEGSCDSEVGWRLLKMYNPPVIWIKDWKILPELLESESKMKLIDKVKRRKNILNWYEWFKIKNRDRFFNFLHNI